MESWRKKLLEKIDKAIELEDKRLARMTPEQRKREIESNERVNKRLEDERKAVEAFEKTLTKEQLELRKKVIGILRPLAPVIVGCTLPEIKAEDMEEVFKAERAEYEEEWKRFASLLKEVGDDPEKIRAVLCKQDALTLGNMPQLFDSEYAEHRTGKQLTEADHFASFAYMYGHVNKKKFDEEEFIGLLKNYKNAQNVDNDCKCKFAKKLSAMFPKFTDHQIENLTRCYECQNHETYTQLIVGKDDYYCKECGFSIKIDMRKDYEIALDGTTNARRRLEQFEMQTQPPSRKEAENLRKKYGKEIWWDEDTVERFINKGGG